MSTKAVKQEILSNLQSYKTKGLTFLKTSNESEITKMIVLSNDEYYNSSSPLLIDTEFDILKEYASEKYPTNSEINRIGAPITKNKVTLPYDMPSMDKIKPDTNALSQWKTKYDGPYVLSCKLDGVSGMYSTENNEPKLYTRGDGKVGQDITHILRVLKLPETQEKIVVRGEFIISKQKFDEKYKNAFSNPRNLVSGIINSKTLDYKTEDLDFVAYEVIRPQMKPSEQMAFLDRLGFNVVQNTYSTKANLTNEMLSNTLLLWRMNYKYEIDGIIVTDDNIHTRKEGNPEHAFAFKMVISDQMAEVKVVDVLWEPSKSGYLKPRVQIEPVQLCGVTIQYVTGFNGSFIESNKIGIGAVIQVIRSGDVIPHIKSVTIPAENPKMPEESYHWTKNHVDLVLDNLENNQKVKEKNITEFFTKLEVDGLSVKTVEKIMEAGLDTIPKILKAPKSEFYKVKGFKETMVNKIYEGIRDKVEKASLLDIMAASNQFGRGIGERKIKPILETCPDILTKQESIEDKYERLLQIRGIGIENARSFTENIENFMEFLKECGLEKKLYIVSNTKSTAVLEIKMDRSHPLFEKRIVMTKFRDPVLKEKIMEKGGIIDENIGKNTHILIVKSKEDQSSKTKYAMDNNIIIMELNEFKEFYGFKTYKI
uniref:DNA ligase (NAD(+)) n=1 Tax=viral metagenome TaxID=1070528 RepID=A0A6C0HSV2_9ZZZZ